MSHHAHIDGQYRKYLGQLAFRRQYGSTYMANTEYDVLVIPYERSNDSSKVEAVLLSDRENHRVFGSTIVPGTLYHNNCIRRLEYDMLYNLLPSLVFVEFAVYL